MLRGVSIKSIDGFGFTMKYRNNDTTSLSKSNPDCAAQPANSSTVIKGNRISFKAGPNTALWLSVVPGNPCLSHSATDHLNKSQVLGLRLQR